MPEDPLPNPYPAMARQWGAATLLLFLATLPASLWLSAWGAILCLLGGIFCGILAVAFALTARGVGEALQSLQGGRALAHWRVDTERHREWWRLQQKTANRMALAAGAMGMLFFGVLALLVWTDAGEPKAAALLFGGALLVVGFAAFLLRRSYAGPEPTGEGEIRIGAFIAVMGRRIYTWRGFGQRFSSAAAMNHPPRLRVVFYSTAKNQEIRQEMVLPAPDLESARQVAVLITRANTPSQDMPSP